MTIELSQEERAAVLTLVEKDLDMMNWFVEHEGVDNLNVAAYRRYMALITLLPKLHQEAA